MLEFVRQATADDALAGPRSLAEMHAAHVERRRREMAPGMAAEAEKRRSLAKAKAEAEAAGKRTVLTKAEAKAQKQRTALAAAYALQAARMLVRGPRVRSLLAATTEEFNVSPLDLLSSRRSAQVALARQAAMYVALITTTWSTPQVGRYFGGRDHTTVMYARDKIAALVAADPEFAARVARIAASVRPAPYLELEASDA